MGEKSKKTGESGEKVIKEFLDLIGWTSVVKGIDIPCVKSSKHKRERSKTETRRTHGIDYLFSYECPLVNKTQETIVVSVKYNENYDTNPTKRFKEHLTDLAMAIECFKFNKEWDLKVNTNIKHKNTTGVIFWLAYNESPTFDLIEKIDDFRNTDDLKYDTIYLVDNRRINFILNTLRYAKTNFPNAKIEFFYPTTGNNLGTRWTSGNILPVQFINSSILPLRIVTGDKAILLLSHIDNFAEEYITRLIGLAQELTLGWTKVVICFPDYHNLNHEPIVNKAKTKSPDISLTSKITVNSYGNIHYTSLEED